MTETDILHQISASYQAILKDNLVGIYVHGSIAFGCFRWEVSDIDFMVVVRSAPSPTEKDALIQVLLELDPHCPPKGLEMSVVLRSVCDPFSYPTPFELHFSNSHKARCRADLAGYCRDMHGVDPDLAAHFNVIRAVGFPLYGAPVGQVFGPVPREAYLDSIRCDIQDAESDILDNPVYIILNLCRVLAYIRDGSVLSKDQGGKWGMAHLPAYAPIIKAALNSYRTGQPFDVDPGNFAGDMLKEIFQD